VLHLTMTQLRQLPVHTGVVLTGSFASEYRKNRFSFVDLHCMCTAVPDDSMRDSFLRGLGIDSSFRFGICEYFTCQNVGVEIRFVTEERQREVLRRFCEWGQDVPSVDFCNAEQHKDCGVSAYEWSTAQILSDTGGTLAAFSEEAKVVPSAVVRALHAKWDPVWRACSTEYHKAKGQGDAVSELACLHHCTVAAFRLFMAHQGFHTSPYHLTGIPQLIRHKPGPFRTRIGADLDFLLYSGRESRMDQLRDLWRRIFLE